MEISKFMIKILNDLKKKYVTVEFDGDIFKIIKGDVEVQIPILQMYQHFVGIGDYSKFFKEYIRNIDDLLKQNVYKVNYDMVFPLIRKNDFGGLEKHFYYVPLFEDLNLYFGEDRGELFRIISKNDKVDFDVLYKQSFENLNKLANPLGKLNDNLDIYSLKFNFDLASSMIFNKTVERSIIKLFGSCYIFAIPASSTLLVASNTMDNIAILKELIKIEKDPNLITDMVIEFKNGKYRYVQ